MANNAEIERIAAEWLARRESGWSEAEEVEFRMWRDASIAHRVAWIRLETGWQRAVRLKALGAGLPSGEVPPPGAWPELPGVDGEHALSPPTRDLRGIVFRPRTVPHPRRALRWTAAAAALLLVTIGLASWWRFGGIERAQYATALGETQRAELADGSVVLLSSDSHVDIAYSRHQRNLRLAQGEAFFEVAPNPDRPFIVEASNHRVVAVGTRFAVRRDAGNLRVAVSEGRVRLEDEERPDVTPTLLIAGMVAVAGRDGVQLHKHTADELEALLGWREGLLVFRSTPLVEAVAEFNRYNTHKLVVDDPSIATIPVGGSFRWTNTDAFIRVLETSFGLRADRQHGETHLRAR